MVSHGGSAFGGRRDNPRGRSIPVPKSKKGGRSMAEGQKSKIMIDKVPAARASKEEPMPLSKRGQRSAAH
jgi:hypothetical protein